MTAEELINLGLKDTNRRMRLFKMAPRCPVCLSRQVQYLHSSPPATWKCRECKHVWRYEPLIERK